MPRRALLPRRLAKAPWYLVVIALVVLALFSSTRAGARLAETAQASSNYDWPTFAHDMARTGYTSVGPVGPFTKQWYRDFWSESREAIAASYQPVAVHDSVHNLDLTYIGTTAGSLTALNLANGATFWRYPAPGQFIGGILSSPTVANGIVYVASLDGNVYALDGTNVSNGVPAVKWIFNSGRVGGYVNTPAVTANAVFVGSRDGYMYALDPNTGAKLWEYNTGAPILMSPAADATKVYVGAENMYAYALNQADGSLAWKSAQLAGQTFRDYYPVIGDGLVFFRTAPNDAEDITISEGEHVLAYAANCQGYPIYPNMPDSGSGNRSGVSCYNPVTNTTSPFNFKSTPSTQGFSSDAAAYAAEDCTIRLYLGANETGCSLDIPSRPQYQTFFALRQSDGTQSFVAPVLYTAGNSNPGEPPVIDGNGKIWVEYRTYYSDFDEPSSAIFKAFGSMDPTTGAITIRNPNPNPTGYSCDTYSCGNPNFTNFWMISDETASYTIGGNNLYLYGRPADGGSMMNLTTGDLAPVDTMCGGNTGVRCRDSAGGALLNDGGTIAARSLAYGSLPPDLNEEIGPTIFGSTIIEVNTSVVGAFVGQIPGTSVVVQPTATPEPVQAFTPTSAPTINIPSSASIQHYIWDVPTPMQIDQADSSDLIAQLNTLVSQYLSTGRLAPWFLIPGRQVVQLAFLDPAETEYFFGLVYPYVTPTLQQQIITFVQADQAAYDPIQSFNGYNWTDGLTLGTTGVTGDPTRLRVPFPPGPYDYQLVQRNLSQYAVPPTPFDRLYDLWYYAYRTGDWSYLENNWTTINQTYLINQYIIPQINQAISTGNDDALLGLPTSTSELNQAGINDSANRRLNAILGYTRIAYHMAQKYPSNSTYQGYLTWGINTATAALQARLRYVNNFRPSDGNGTDVRTSSWVVAPDVGSGIFDQRIGQQTNIPEYRDLTPEVGKFLADNALPDFVRYQNFMNTVFPTFYLHNGYSNLIGEELFGYPSNVQGYFLANALVTRLPGPLLRKYVDIPATQEDMYYIERLARTIENYGPLGIDDSRIPFANQQPSLAEYSASLQVQK